MNPGTYYSATAIIRGSDTQFFAQPQKTDPQWIAYGYTTPSNHHTEGATKQLSTALDWIKEQIKAASKIIRPLDLYTRPHSIEYQQALGRIDRTPPSTKH